MKTLFFLKDFKIIGLITYYGFTKHFENKICYDSKIQIPIIKAKNIYIKYFIVNENFNSYNNKQKMLDDFLKKINNNENNKEISIDFFTSNTEDINFFNLYNAFLVNSQELNQKSLCEKCLSYILEYKNDHPFIYARKEYS
jgi:hypothetical protein